MTHTFSFKQRVVLAAFGLALLCSCAQDRAKMPFVPMEGERIDLTQANPWNSVSLSIDRHGQGRFELDHFSKKTMGSFAIAPGEFEHLSQLLAEFKKNALPDGQPAQAGP